MIITPLAIPYALMLQNQAAPTKGLWTHSKKTTIRTRFMVTTCLYRIPNKRAMSRSTEMAVIVDKDTPEKIVLNRNATYSSSRHSSKVLWLIPVRVRAIDTDCEIKPAQRSVIVRLKSNSLDGGLRLFSLRSATRIKMFARVVATERKPYMTVENIAKAGR